MWRFLSGLLLGFVLGAAAIVLLSSYDEGPPPRPAEEDRPRYPTSVPGLREDAPPPSRTPPAANEPPARAGTETDPSPITRIPERTTGNDPLIELLRRLGEAEPPSEEELDRIFGRLARHSRRKDPSLPGELVRRLLLAPDTRRRKLGAAFAYLSDPLPIEALRRLAATDPIPEVRSRSLRALVHHRRLVPDCRAICISAASDRIAGVRMTAVQCLRFFGEGDPEAAAVIVAATRDPDYSVRREAIAVLPNAGAAGGERAAELILDGEYDWDTVESLAGAVVKGGKLLYVLDRGVGPEYVTPMIKAVPEEKAPLLAGRFGQLLPLFQPESSGSYDQFFSLAAKAKEAEFLVDVALSRDRPWEIRSSAIRAGIEHEATRPTVMDSALSLIRDHEEQPRLRVQVIRLLADQFDENGRMWPAVERALVDAARKDTSPWVRDAAREHVDPEQDD